MPFEKGAVQLAEREDAFIAQADDLTGDGPRIWLTRQSKPDESTGLTTRPGFRMNAVLTSLELSREIEAVEHELSELRARAEEDSSAFAALEQQVAEIGENLARTHSTISKHEARLADKQAELAEAKRLEALANYKKDLRAQHEASTRVVRAATDLIATLNTYDDETLRLRKLVEEMRYAFGNDERVGEVEAALEHEPEELLEAWAAVVGTLGWRVNGANGGADNWDPEVLAEELAQQRRVARIKEYFSRS